MDLVTKGQLSPVFFGSALTNFGVETFLQHFLKMKMCIRDSAHAALHVPADHSGG